MSAILQRWLCTRLGIILDIHHNFFGELVSDGILLARLLQSYDIIDEVQVKFLRATNDPVLRYENLRHLRVWLELIGVCCDDSALKEIADGNGSTAIRLVYQMYLCFENKHKLRSLNLHKRKEEIKSRFQIKKLSKCQLKYTHTETSNPLEAPLISQRNILEWKTLKSKAVKESWKSVQRSCDVLSATRPAKAATGKNEDQGELVYREMRAVDAALIDVDLTYDDLVGLSKSIRETPCECTDINAAKNYVAKLHRNSQNKDATKSFQLQMRRLLMTELSSKLMAKQELAFDQRITMKLLKQSQYEKQMTTKLMQARLEKKAMAENRILLDKLLTEMREKEFCDGLTRMRDEIDAQKEGSNWEADKTKELHARLYAEKQQLLYEKNYDMCMEVVDAIVDLSVKTSNYISENGGTLPRKIWNEWKEMFFTRQPIFDVMPDIEYILEDQYSDELEQIAFAEFGRQEILNEHDLRDYLSLSGPWQMSELCPDEIVGEPDQVVLGYIVHHLLDIKHPLPPLPSGAGLPPMTAAAILQGVHEQSVIDALGQLLAEQRLLVIMLDDAINFCLEQFKDEMKVVRDIDLRLCRATEKAKDELEAIKVDKSKKPKKSVKKEKDEKKLKKVLEKEKKSKKKNGKDTTNSKNEENIEVIESVVYEKETQTPRRIPDDDPLLSVPADLGRKAFDILCLGEQIPDQLLVQMLVEFLRERASDIRGFVLMNYPINYEQASILEEVLTGRSLPPLEKPTEADLVEVIEELEIREMELEEKENTVVSLEELRSSRLVPNPIPPRPSAEFRTFFTAFIHAKKVTEGEESDNDDPLEAVYTDQGMNYEIYYESLDFPAVKQLARLIIGDMVLPRKASVELFGECLKGIEEMLIKSNDRQVEVQVKKKKGKSKDNEPEIPVKIEEEERPPITEILVEEEHVKKGKEKKSGKGGEKSGASTKSGKKDKKGNKKKKDEDMIENIVEETELEIEVPPIETVQPKVEEVVAEKIPPAKSGEYGWVFVDLPQPFDIQCALATLWENLEAVYLKDFKELFFEKRVILAKVMPYLNHARRGMEAFISRPDDKQSHVLAFQLLYNAIEEELRPDVEMKNELHCRVAELRAFLHAACDLRMTQAEAQRRTVVDEQWFPGILSQLVNVHVEAMQLEVDRSMDTLQLITDHYLGSLGSNLTKNRLAKPQVARMTLNLAESLTSVDGKHRVSVERAKISSTLQMTDRLLRDVDSDRHSITPFHNFISNTVQSLSSHLSRLKAELGAELSKEATHFKDKCGKKAKGNENKKGKEGKKGKASKKEKESKKEKGSKKAKDEHGKGHDEGTIATNEIADVGERLFEEWQTALLEETERVQLRLRLLNIKALKDVSSVLDTAQDVFHKLFHNLTSRYEQEINAVDELAKAIGVSIEDELPIQAELILEQDRFYRSSKKMLFPDSLPLPAIPVEEIKRHDSFTVVQLLHLVPMFVRAAPSSVLPRAALAYMLQDVAIQDDFTWLPAQWYNLTHDEIATVVCELSAGAEYADWKEFVIRCLDVGYPTAEEVVSLRAQYSTKDPRGEELVSRADFDDVRLWFEREHTNDERETLHRKLVKNLIFELFQVGADSCNYTAMLLYFCKDIDPRDGLAKALALVLGVLVITSEEECHEDALGVTSSTLVRRAFEVAEEVIDDVVDEVIVTVAGIKIEEVHSESTIASKQKCDSSIESDVLHPPVTPASLHDVTARLPFGVVLNLLTACMPWWASCLEAESNSLGVRLEAVYEELARGHEAVIAHQFFAHPFVDDLFKATNKFQICRMADVVQEVIERRR